jgi:chemotaxis protein MotA
MARVLRHYWFNPFHCREQSLNRIRPLVAIGVTVAFSTGVLLYGSAPGWLIVVAGFVFVIGGTLTATLISEGIDRTEEVLRKVPGVFSKRHRGMDLDEKVFLQVSEAYRRGLVRHAERGARGIADSFLGQGAQLIVDGAAREELERSLQWRIANAREEEKRHLRVMQAMAGFAPAFGMLGTLLGLVRMLFGLGESGLDMVGSAMGFAMVTTVYGLVAANLVIKPAISRMEQQSREYLAGYHIRYELLMMMFSRENAALMRESLEGFLGRPVHGDRQTGQQPRSAVRLVGA